MKRFRKKVRCAVYTRKSSDEGLELEFNSLDAQREACEAYIKSQNLEGWCLINKQYDDGGFSGGTMERPAFQELLKDIENNRIDIVVVYKVDRLTRSLNDFSKIIDIFDKHQTSFISITQQFNTTTSMGRLTLNILLSFAQFEREVTGERIRDKFEASRKKGLWLSGTIPYGYSRGINQILVPHYANAKNVLIIYEEYLKIQNLSRLREYLYSKKIWIKRGRRISKSGLRHILSNKVYLGKIIHNGQEYDGLHKALISENLFLEVQDLLEVNTLKNKHKTYVKKGTMLNGLVYDEANNKMKVVYSSGKNKNYKYYVSNLNRFSADFIDTNVLKDFYNLLLEEEILQYYLNRYETCEPKKILREMRQFFPDKVFIRSVILRVSLEKYVLNVLYDISFLINFFVSKIYGKKMIPAIEEKQVLKRELVL